MAVVESLALKALAPLARFAPSAAAAVQRRVVADHQAIAGVHPFRPASVRFSLTVGVSPSRTPCRLDPVRFTERAHACARLILERLSFTVDHSSSELVRFAVPDTDPSGARNDLHQLAIYPTGLVELQWGMDVTFQGSNEAILALDEVVDVLTLMHRVSRHPSFHALRQVRRTEKYRRLDWRVGLTPSIATNERGTIYWTGLRATGQLPGGRSENQRPWCPIDGYAASRLRSIKPSTPAGTLFRPVLEQLLVDAGYLDVGNCVTEALESPSRPALTGTG